MEQVILMNQDQKRKNKLLDNIKLIKIQIKASEKLFRRYLNYDPGLEITNDHYLNDFKMHPLMVFDMLESELNDLIKVIKDGDYDAWKKFH